MLRLQLYLNEINRNDWDETEAFFKASKLSKSKWLAQLVTMYTPKELLMLKDKDVVTIIKDYAKEKESHSENM